MPHQRNVVVINHILEPVAQRVQGLLRRVRDVLAPERREHLRQVMPSTLNWVARELAEDPLTGPRLCVGDECRHVGMQRDLVHALRLRRLSLALRSYPYEWNATFLPHVVLVELENFFEARAR